MYILFIADHSKPYMSIECDTLDVAKKHISDLQQYNYSFAVYRKRNRILTHVYGETFCFV